MIFMKLKIFKQLFNFLYKNKKMEIDEDEEKFITKTINKEDVKHIETILLTNL